MNFKGEYKVLKQVYPDIDKISKNAHFTIKWVRTVQHVDRSQLSEGSNKKSQANHLEASQKKEEPDQFFSVAEVEHSELSNGQVILEKEARSLYRKLGEKWVKIEEGAFEVSNG
jgi:Golgi nucleoside diphosphatase